MKSEKNGTGLWGEAGKRIQKMGRGKKDEGPFTTNPGGGGTLNRERGGWSNLWRSGTTLERAKKRLGTLKGRKKGPNKKEDL